ncbi:MAG TPA: hypothetical protein VGK59_18705 [Ohtaekwangia sp.]
MENMSPLLITILLLSCATSRSTLMLYGDWDGNHDRFLDQQEFVNTYVRTDYFSKWSYGNSATYPELFDGVFASLDANKDHQLSQPELDEKIKPFFFNMYRNTFADWDTDHSGSVSQSEFSKLAAASNLSSLWDTDGDKSISRTELALGMFYLGDTDNDRKLNELEFNIWNVNR